MKTKLASLNEFVEKFVGGELDQYTTNLKEYKENILIPFNASVIEIVIGKEFTKKNDEYVLTKHLKLPNADQLSDVILMFMWFSEHAKNFDSLFGAQDGMECKLVSMPPMTAMNNKDFTAYMRTMSLKRLTIEDLHEICKRGAIQRQSWDRNWRLFYGLVGIVLIGGAAFYAAKRMKELSAEVEEYEVTDYDLDDLDDDLDAVEHVSLIA